MHAEHCSVAFKLHRFYVERGALGESGYWGTPLGAPSSSFSFRFR